MANEKQESLYSKDLFNEEMKMIDDEINDLNNLYGEIKTHFDKVKNSQARGSLVFIKDQTNNLISIKTAKLNYIKQKADLKKNITDFAFKEKNANNKENEGIDTITAEIYKKIANDFKYVPDKQQESHTSVFSIDDENDIENMLDDELNDVDINNIVESTTSIEEVNVEYNTDIFPNEEIVINDETTTYTEKVANETTEEDNSIVTVDLDTLTFYSLDKNTMEVIEELGFIEKIVDTVEIDNETYAIGEGGTIYLTVTFMEDEE